MLWPKTPIAREGSPKPPLLGEVARRSRDGGVSGLCHVVILCFFLRLEAQPKAATPQALRASSPSSGAKRIALPAGGWRFTAHLAGEPRKWLQIIRRRSQGKSTANQKPPLLGEVARRSRDGGVSGLCHVVILCVFLRLKAQPKAATPQALRASSPSSGAKKLLYPQGDGDSQAAKAAVHCAPGSGAKKLLHVNLTRKGSLLE